MLESGNAWCAWLLAHIIVLRISRIRPLHISLSEMWSIPICVLDDTHRVLCQLPHASPVDSFVGEVINIERSMGRRTGVDWMLLSSHARELEQAVQQLARAHLLSPDACACFVVLRERMASFGDSRSSSFFGSDWT